MKSKIEACGMESKINCHLLYSLKDENKHNHNLFNITTGIVNDYFNIDDPSSQYSIDTNQGNDKVEIQSSGNQFSGKIFLILSICFSLNESYFLLILIKQQIQSST